MIIPYEQIRVLIVEDARTTRDILKDLLLSLGFSRGNIVEASDGTEALDAMQRGKVGLIICDNAMAPMDGLTFVRKLRDPDSSRNPFVPIIFCSSHTDKALIRSAVDAGVNEIMTKPISRGALESRINAIFEAPRPFVVSEQYFGPDRRRRVEDFPLTKERRRRRRTVVKQLAEGQKVKEIPSSD